MKTPGINTTSSSITAFSEHCQAKFPIEAVSEIIAVSSTAARLEIPVLIEGFTLEEAQYIWRKLNKDFHISVYCLRRIQSDSVLQITAPALVVDNCC